MKDRTKVKMDVEMQQCGLNLLPGKLKRTCLKPSLTEEEEGAT